MKNLLIVIALLGSTQAQSIKNYWATGSIKIPSVFLRQKHLQSKQTLSLKMSLRMCASILSSFLQEKGFLLLQRLRLTYFRPCEEQNLFQIQNEISYVQDHKLLDSITSVEN